MLCLRTTSVALMAGAVALACSDSNQPVGPTDQSTAPASAASQKVTTAQGGPEDPIELGSLTTH